MLSAYRDDELTTVVTHYRESDLPLAGKQDVIFEHFGRATAVYRY